MTSFVFTTATTLNGFLADDADSLDWLTAVPEADAATAGVDEFLLGIGALTMGASTYAWLLEHGGSSVWADSYGDRPCFVATHRALPEIAGANLRFVAGPPREWAQELADAAGDRDVWIVGGGDLVGQFDDAGLLDEIRVSVAPVVLESGKPLLPRRIESDRLRLVETSQSGQFAELVYRVTRRADVSSPTIRA